MIDPDIEIDAEEHRRGVTDREEGHVDADVLHPVEEEDHAEQEQDVIVARRHVFGAEIHEGDEVHPGDLLDVALVAGGNAVRESCRAPCRRQEKREHGGAKHRPDRVARLETTFDGRVLHGWFRLSVRCHAVVETASDQAVSDGLGGRSWVEASFSRPRS